MMRHHQVPAGYRSQPIFKGIQSSFLWVLSSILVLVIGLPAAFIQKKAAPKATPPPPPPPLIEAKITTVGVDKNQRSLPFTIYVLSQQRSWKLESTNDLEGEQSLLNPELMAEIGHAPDVFCVGTASFEGGTKVEEARADQRAGKLALWVVDALGKSPHLRLFTLNAGQYKGPDELASSLQRKAIILATGPHDEKVNLTEGLQSGLERQQQTSPVVYSLLHHYSRSKGWLANYRKRPL